MQTATHRFQTSVKVALSEAIDAPDEGHFLDLLALLVSTGESPEYSYEIESYSLAGVDLMQPGVMIIDVIGSETVRF